VIGRTVSHYRVASELGAGGMGVVYRAEDLTLKRQVALKFLPPHLSSDPEARRRFLLEAQAAASLDHPGICAVHESGEAEGQLFIAMALLEGQTPKNLIAGGALPVPQALDIAAQVAEALQEAHAKGVTHRDIKPANIMLTPDGRAKVMDFGLAQVTGTTRLTRSGSTMGTAAYMSPEQAQGSIVDQRTDIWSLGVIMYEMLSGRLPFRGDIEPALLYSIMNQDPDPLTGLRPDVPIEIEHVVMRSLAKDPKKRYASVGEVLRDLREIHARQDTLRRRGKWSLWRMRHRRTATATTLMLAAAIVSVGALRLLPGRTQPIDSVAVLPLDNVSGDPEQEYFVDGMTDELIDQLGKVQALTVISRTSSMRYKNADKSLPQIARELRVRSVVEGSVRRDADRVRVSLRLVDARRDRSLWSDTFDLTMAGVFAMQTEVATKVVRALKTTLASGEPGRLEVRRAPNAEAYELLLKGRYYANKLIEHETRKGIGYYQQALELDPGYAEAYEDLAVAYWRLSVYGRVPPSETVPRQKEYALKALELDPMSGRAHAILAHTLGFYEWQWRQARSEMEQAVALAPNDARVLESCGGLLWYLDRANEAVAQYQRAVQLDPFSVGLRQNLGETFYYARRYDEAIAASLEAIEMDPRYPQAHMFLGFAYAAKGMKAEALRALDRDMEISGGNKPEIDSWIAIGYATAGDTARARMIYKALVERSRSEYVSLFPLACACFALGDIDRGFAWLEKGYAQRDHRMAFLKVHPACDVVRSDPRYIELVRRMGW
jgi:serine/threonine protein kinase/Tfp pilus assembly protein PilF